MAKRRRPAADDDVDDTEPTTDELQALEDELIALQLRLKRAKKQTERLAISDRLVRVSKEIARQKRRTPALPKDLPKAKPQKPLTERQRKFVEAYMGEAAGNGTKAARLAGFSGDDAACAVRASELMRHDGVRAAIEERQREDPLVVTRVELQRFWSKQVRGDRVKQLVDGTEIEAVPPLGEANKAASSLAKSFGMFVQRVQIEEDDEQIVVELPDNGRGDRAPSGVHAGAPLPQPQETGP